MNNFFTVKYISEQLNKDLKGSVISEIFSQEKDKLCIGINSVKGSGILEFSAQKKFPYLLLKRNFSKAKRNAVNLFQEIEGMTALGADLLNNDRIIKLTLSGGYYLLFTFFTGKANCFLIKDDSAVNAFKEKEDFSGQPVDELFPQKNSEEVRNYRDLNEFIRSEYRKFGSTYINEALYRSDLKKSSPADETSVNTLRENFKKLEKEMDPPVFLLYKKDDDLKISLTRLSHLNEYQAEEFPDINELLISYLRISSGAKRFTDAKENALAEINRKLIHQKRKLEGLEKNLEHSRNSEELKDKGNLILQNIHSVKKGDTVLNVNDFNDPNKKTEIKLKAELSPSENAEVYFNRYKKLKNSDSLLLKKISELKKNISELESEFRNVDESDDFKKIIKEEKKLQESKNDETSKFRKFILNDKYQVWVGKDSVSNDLLTTKYASQNDLWFHVRGASGSHTVLKISTKESVPKEIISAAASISAYYSKARNAGNVPVAYCEKKHVKKKKGFKSGTVTMEREKVIFVKPALPEDFKTEN
ncbi:MAG: DUF814 domain-containing protein [Bacteroidetes bacterium]|nr:DUF814 domain-containing protein [Bacteroidota bacterium]